MLDGNIVFDAHVSIPELGLHTKTGIDGTFTLGNVIYGTWLFVATNLPLPIQASLEVTVPTNDAVVLSTSSSPAAWRLHLLIACRRGPLAQRLA